MTSVFLSIAAATAVLAIAAEATAQDRDDLQRKYAHEGLLSHNVFDMSPEMLRRMSREGLVLRSYEWEGQSPRRVYLPALNLVNRNYDSDIFGAVRFYGQYYPATDQYGASMYVNKRAMAQQPLARPEFDLDSFSVAALPGDEGTSGTVGRSVIDTSGASQQPVMVEVRTADGRMKTVITSEPIPDALRHAWVQFAGRNDAAAIVAFREMTSSSPHATDGSREATLGLLLSQAGAALRFNRNVADAGERLSSALQADAALAGSLPDNAEVASRVRELVARAQSLAETAEDAAPYRQLADALGRVGG